jgi:hypothetical protein
MGLPSALPSTRNIIKIGVVFLVLLFGAIFFIKSTEKSSATKGK